MEGGQVSRLSGGAARGLEGATWSALHHHDALRHDLAFTPLRPGYTAVYILVKRLDWLASCFDGSATSSRFAVGSLDLSSFPALVAHDAFPLVDQGSTHAGNTTRRCRSVVPACLHGQRHAVHRRIDGGAVLQ